MLHLLKGTKEKKTEWPYMEGLSGACESIQGAVREPILIELVIINQLLIHFKSISKY